MLRLNLRRRLPFLLSGLLFVLLCVGAWWSLRPRWKTFVSPPLRDGTRLTFRYPADWKLVLVDRGKRSELVE